MIKNFGLMIVIMAMILTGCDETVTDPVIPTFSPDIVSVTEGSSTVVTITSGTAPFSVSSSSGAIATANVEGRSITVTGISVGTVNVTVSGSDGGSARLAVAVTQQETNAPTLSESALELEEGFTTTLEITNGTPAFSVSSSDSDIATATVSGTTVTVTGVSGGTALITVTGSDGATATCAVNVNNEQIFFGPDRTQLGSGRKEFSIKRNHTIRKGVYTLVGWIYVEEGATLTIEPGTIFKGTDYSFDGTKSATGSTLIIKRGGKIIADGTREQPIVFTSAQPKGQRQATDWGGIIICGNAKNNQGQQLIEGGVDAYHGGNDDNDNSGILRYVRIEFGGYPYAQDTEINGLTLGSVGNGTTIEYVQISYSGDDSFEWFGGTVNGKYLIAYHGWDDDFDTDSGFSGKIQFALSVRDPKIADTSNSNGFESDNDSPGSSQTPFTTARFSNVTSIGPIGQDPDFQNNSSYIDGYNWGSSTTAAFPIKPGIFQSAMQIRRNSRLSCFNSVFAGYPVGLLLDKQRGDTQGAATRGELKIKNVFMAGMGRLGADDNATVDGTWTGDFSANYFKQAELNNRELSTIGELMLKQPNSKAADANWGPMANSPLLGAANFDDAFLNDAFFTTVTYSGAFASDSEADNWTKGWANFDPQNTDY